MDYLELLDQIEIELEAEGFIDEYFSDDEEESDEEEDYLLNSEEF